MFFSFVSIYFTNIIFKIEVLQDYKMSLKSDGLECPKNSYLFRFIASVMAQYSNEIVIFVEFKK